jgi:NADH-quinone oxidoreductase subunit C
MSDNTSSGFDAVASGPTPSGGDQAADAGFGPPAQADHPAIAAMAARFGDAVERYQIMPGNENHSDQFVVYVREDSSYDIMDWLQNDPEQSFELLSDVTAVDYGGGRPLEVVYNLFSMKTGHALRVKVELPLNALKVRSVVPLWNGANWLEREVYDLFGIDFEGHPDLRRILMPENYAEGHPLRKDFPLRGRFSRAEQTRRALSQNPEDYYIPGEMGEQRIPQVITGDDADQDEA